MVLALGVLSGGATACHGGPTATTGEPTTTTTAETDTDTDTTDAVPAEPDPRFFRTFHTDEIHVGWSNEDFPDDVIVLSPFSLVTFDPSGTMRYEYYQCGDLLTHMSEHAWSYAPEAGAMHVLPGETGVIEQLWDPPLRSLSVTMEAECDGIMITMTDTTEREIVRRYRPGRVCAEVSDPERCRFTIAWCDEGEPGPLCPAP